MYHHVSHVPFKVIPPSTYVPLELVPPVSYVGDHTSSKGTRTCPTDYITPLDQYPLAEALEATKLMQDKLFPAFLGAWEYAAASASASASASAASTGAAAGAGAAAAASATVAAGAAAVVSNNNNNNNNKTQSSPMDLPAAAIKTETNDDPSVVSLRSFGVCGTTLGVCGNLYNAYQELKNFIEYHPQYWRESHSYATGDKGTSGRSDNIPGSRKHDYMRVLIETKDKIWETFDTFVVVVSVPGTAHQTGGATTDLQLMGTVPMDYITAMHPVDESLPEEENTIEARTIHLGDRFRDLQAVVMALRELPLRYEREYNDVLKQKQWAEQHHRCEYQNAIADEAKLEAWYQDEKLRLKRQMEDAVTSYQNGITFIDNIYAAEKPLKRQLVVLSSLRGNGTCSE